LKKIQYYVSDIGRGHATRTVAVVRDLKKLGFEVIIRNSNVIEFLQYSLPNVKILDGLTDVGPYIKSDGIFIDEVKTKQNVNCWINEINYYVEKEQKILEQINPNLIISDISILPFLSNKKKKASSIAISNFSWYDIWKFLPDDKSQVIKHAYDNVDLAIQLPMGSNMDHFKRKDKVGFISRKPTKSKEELRKKLGIKDDEKVVLFAMGTNEIGINCETEDNIKILTMNAVVLNNQNVINVSEYPEGQDVVTASDLVICKCGYGIASECLTNGIPFLYFVSNNPIEKIQAEALSKSRFGEEIKLDDLKNFNLKQNPIELGIQQNKEPLDNEKVISYILEFLRN